MMMNFFSDRSFRDTLVVNLLFLTFVSAGSAKAEAPEPLQQYLEADKTYTGAIGAVLPPDEIQDYIKLVKESAVKDPEWFREYSAEAKAGVPLPYHEKLGLSEEQYAAYRKLWDQREFKEVEPVKLRLEKSGDDWVIRATGGASRISLLRFDAKKGVFFSPNGELKRINDIDAAPETILGGWTGVEWKFEEETGLGRTKENVALGRTKDGNYGYLVYRLQDVTITNQVTHDRSIVVRFQLK